MRASDLLLYTSLLQASCTPENVPCQAPISNPGSRSGYVLEWTARAPVTALDVLCGYPANDGAALIRFEIAVVRGTGPNHVGAALRRDLEPRLLKRFGLDGWSLSCRDSFTVTLDARRSRCQVNDVIEVIGDYLRQRRANDRVVIQMGLAAAPAL